MPKIKSFKLEHFKGAHDLVLKMDGKTQNRIITLIGLNESGKTTILEGISNFPTNDGVVSAMFNKEDESAHALTIIPVHTKANFTGEVRISGDIELTSEDLAGIKKVIERNGYQLDPAYSLDKIRVAKEYTFSNGDFINSRNVWTGIDLPVRHGRRGAYKKFARPKKDEIAAGAIDIWDLSTDYLEEQLPNVVYFPNFLVDVPQRIYLSFQRDETESNRYYRKILQNVLDSLGEGLSLRTHVVDRIKKYKEQEAQGWIASLFGSAERGKIEPVFSKLSVAISREVLGSWGKVFNRPVAAKRIEVSWSVDPENDLPYAEIRVSDGESQYHLHERSLGFRWFFSFLLFTKFGGTRGRPNLFLFDEPAANLHARAQAELLESFSKLVEGGDSVIYSTHSHHMIKPEWLAGAYIVENEAIDYDSESGGFDYDVKNTKVRLTPYRQFVGTHGDRVSYFQPVLERLQYVEPAVASVGPQIMLEGPSDFYALKYVLSRSIWADKIRLVPGGGAGSLNPMISIALSRGYRFCILLDDDKAGKRQQSSYRERWSLQDDEVLTLADIDSTLAGQTIEGTLSKAATELVRARFGNAQKQSVANYLAEIAATSAPNGLDTDTEKRLMRILELLCPRLL